MKNTWKIFFYVMLFSLFLNKTFAAWWDGWVTWLTAQKLRNWNFTYEDIPGIFVNATDFFIGIAWTIAVIVIIIWAYKYLISWITGDSSKWKDTIIAALIGFWLAACSYLIIKFLIDNFASSWSLILNNL